MKIQDVREKWFTVEEVSEISNFSDQIIRRALRAGALVGKKSGSQWRISKSEYEKWKDEAFPTAIRNQAIIAPPGELLDQHQAAEWLNLSVVEVETYANLGMLLSYEGKFHILDLDRFIKDHRGSVIIPIIGESREDDSTWDIGQMVDGVEVLYEMADEFCDHRADYQNRRVRWPGRS